MSPRRFASVFSLEFRGHLRKPNLWILISLMCLLSWGLSLGEVTISSGDSAVGGEKAWITSQFAMAYVLSTMIFSFYSFFVAVLAGMAIIRDDELKAGEILHATPLTAGEYVWGKFSAAVAAFGGVVLLHLAFAAFFNHLLPNSAAAEIRGPFHLSSYLVPAFIFGLPPILLIAGVCFAVGERTRRPILVFVLPLAVVLFGALFLWNWSPTWLDPRVNRLLMLLDPSGFRWLNETWLKVDRGVRFYNEGRIGLDLPFVLSRIGFAAVGLAAVWYSQIRLRASLRGAGAKVKKGGGKAVVGRPETDDSRPTSPLASLGMGIRPPSFIKGALEAARIDFRELASSPGIYLFTPIIIMQAIGKFISTGAFEAPMLLTPGYGALGMMNTLTLLVCLLLLFYTVESLWRDRATGLGSIIYASPLRSGALLLGKSLANGMVGVSILVAALVTCWVAVLVQGKVPFSLAPFAILWGLLLVPTFLMWTAFVAAVFSVTRSRYATYGVALAAFVITIFMLFRQKVNWVGNWPIWGSVTWSDMGPLELDRSAIVLNRLFVLSLFALFLWVAVKFFPRRSRDASLVLSGFRPSALARGAAKALPFILAPIILGTLLYIKVDNGYGGGAAEKKGKDYWKQNLATWKDAPLPDLASVDVSLDIDPQRSHLKSSGSMMMVNRRESPMASFCLTGGLHWKNVRWTMDGAAYEPENRTGLYVFTPKKPIENGQGVCVGFSFEGAFPDGISKNGGGLEEFILPSGVVLTSFTPSFMPVLGYIEEIGVDEKNKYEPKVYPDDFYRGVTEPLFGSASSFTTKVSVTIPSAYTANSVGYLASEAVSGGRRTSVWRSDHPVRLLNVVAGRWAVERGVDTAVFYHPAHRYNIGEMSEALQASRKYYSEWFYEYPWRELKLSEFPALSTYAQGFPTDITFSEGIGFLTKSEPKTNTAFAVTAHEAAHQWWGNIVTPGKGPGGNVVAEGLSHCSTAFLLEQVKGPLQAMEFRKRIEEKYGNVRRKDSERPIVKVDGSKDGDNTVMYDRGGWVFWMLCDFLGREAALEGLREFVLKYKDGPDYPVIQDLLEVMRGHAADPAAFDAFATQWFYEVTVPEYKVVEATRRRTSGGWEVKARVRNEGSGSIAVEVAAARGERMDEKGKPAAGYLDARSLATVGPNEEKEVAIASSFEPDRVLVDPDVRVLQLKRNKALRRF